MCQSTQREASFPDETRFKFKLTYVVPTGAPDRRRLQVLYPRVLDRKLGVGGAIQVNVLES